GVSVAPLPATEASPLAVRSRAARNALVQVIAVHVGVVVVGGEHADATKELLLRPTRVAGLPVDFAVAHLRHEAVVGTEVLAVFRGLDEPVHLLGAMGPVREEGVVGAGLTAPLAGQVRTVGGLALAPERLSGEIVGTTWPPLEVGS